MSPVCMTNQLKGQTFTAILRHASAQEKADLARPIAFFDRLDPGTRSWPSSSSVGFCIPGRRKLLDVPQFRGSGRLFAARDSAVGPSTLLAGTVLAGERPWELAGDLSLPGGRVGSSVGAACRACAGGWCVCGLMRRMHESAMLPWAREREVF